MHDDRHIRLPSLGARLRETRASAGVAAPDDPCHACGACPDRRDFLRVGLAGVLATALAGALPREVAAAPVLARLRTLRARGTAGGELRYPVPAEAGVHVDRDNEVILVRYQGVLGAFALSCPHQRSLLRWREDDGIFQCTKHRSRYSPLGEYIEGRATRNMDRLAIRLDAGDVVVDPSTVYHSDDDPDGWAADVVPVP